ncbi:ribonuclease T2 [Dichomitus squalens LYAD-421 SS1]|uniref:ribonuclease T2 n=1 Tax=Dichomitus squalens (strain LYAD-421) TaxID=732165 RepID=UPI0004410C49|nr:ribonuclease T2 [Dichomitus squalens LYAD-421 SS1]EJF67147.1 ribonuclease T2 [Dichomitus squalens LYAD-421 SS1]
MLAATLALGVALAGTAVAGPSPFTSVGPLDLFKRISSGCSTSGPASCHNTTKQTDLCCFESPGGLLLQTQFWDTNPSTGPANSWTIHGLWPDNCDGTFSENCDSSRDYTDIAGLLTDQGASDTLSYMQEFWVDINGQNEQFWEHEWSTHGTCYSTLKPSCLPSGSPKGAEAVAFFQIVVKLFKTLPTYDWLSAAGITPSSSKTFTLSTLTSALKDASGVTPALNCDGSNLNSIEWYFNVKGSLLDGTFVPIDAPSKGSCSSSGIKYPPKSGASTTISKTSTATTHKSTTTKTTTTTTSGGSSPTGSPLPSKGTIHASSTGGLISAGTWSTQTLATYTFSGTTSSFTLSSSKGSCGVSSGKFSCGSDVSASTFSAVSSGSDLLLAFGGSTAFSADDTPSGSTQETVYTGSSHSETFTLSIVSS